MCITSLRHPHKIFLTAPPLPGNIFLTDLPRAADASKTLWRPCDPDDSTLTRILRTLQQCLRLVHQRKIAWPDDECYLPEYVHFTLMRLWADLDILSAFASSDYLMILLEPIPTIFNQLHSQYVLKTPMKCVELKIGHPPVISGATFEAEDFERFRLTPPITLFLQSESVFCSALDDALFLAWEQAPSANIIVTNLKDIVVFLPSSPNRPEPTFERISTTKPALALRVIVTAYLLDALLPGLYIEVPDLMTEIDESSIPQGPPQGPHQPLLADEVVFATHRSHSDFDIVSLVRDPARALQFFRWHKHVQNQLSKLVAHPNDTLIAKTNEARRIIPDIRPAHPFNASQLPSDTTEHIKSTQRESPLVTNGVAGSFARSKAFTLKIQDVLSEGNERGICTVYRCQLTSIDEVPVSGPSLCLKLFDDRFQTLPSPGEDENELNVDLPRWFYPVIYAETYALNEAFAYEKLEIVQGSVVPWFYGIHQFTLPDGIVLTGLVMEYIPGWKLDTSFARGLSPERQIQLIKSCRHGARILDVADIAQHDWHHEQVILYTNPATHLDHAVLLDFASTTQTWEPQGLNLINNYFGMLRVLLGREGEVGLDSELVWKHYGEPDDWDPIQAWIPTRPNGSAYEKNQEPYEVTKKAVEGEIGPKEEGSDVT